MSPLSLIPEVPWIVAALAAVVVGVLAAGRITRAIYYDAFPPSVWLRTKWDKLTSDDDGEPNDWNLLLHCPWCLGHWVTLGVGVWFALGFLAAWIAIAWWIIMGWFALSYLVSMIIVRDEPGDE